MRQAEKMDGLTSSKLSDLPKVRQHVSGGPRSPVKKPDQMTKKLSGVGQHSYARLP